MWKKLQGWVILGVLLLSVSFAYRWVTARFIIPPIRIHDTERGMEPLIMAGESVWRLDRALLSTRDLRFGDIVVFLYPGLWEDEGLIPGRIAGLPGDTISFCDGKLWRNGKEAIESWNPKRDYACNAPPVLVPRNHVYLLMDNRVYQAGRAPRRHDSRELKPVPFSLLVGRMIHFTKRGS